MLAITDERAVNAQKLKELESIEEWMRAYPSVEDVALEDALGFMKLTVPAETLQLLDEGDDAGYAQAVMSEASRLWRSLALLLHPDKAKTEKFWLDGDRLQRFFQLMS